MFQYKGLSLLILFSFLNYGCKDPKLNPIGTNPDRTAESHSGDAKPKFELVFPEEKVNTIEISFRKSTFDSLEANLKMNYLGIEFGIGATKLTNVQVNKLSASGSSQFFGLAPPAYFETSVKFNNKTWNNVGFKFDQAVPLIFSYLNGVKKMPFRLQFDKFLKANSDIRNQKLYGFKDLQFMPGYSDMSMIRDKIGSAIFRDNGISAPRTSFCKIYIDYGEGKKYYGLYTITEATEDTMIKNVFGNNSGNIYEPETSMKFYSKSSFYKKNNQAANDYADVETLVAVINSSKRKTNYTEWKANLEKNFDIETYLKWLAINTAIRADDGFTGSYTLYNLPNRKLTWIPSGFTTSLRLPAPSTNPNVPDTDLQVQLDWKKTSDAYPLIRYVIDDPIYFAKYKKHMADFHANYFNNGKLEMLIDRNHALAAPYITGVDMEVKPYTQLSKPADFDKGKLDMKAFLVKQSQNIIEFLK